MEEKTVLLVEDSPSQALASRLLLEEKGLKVLWAANGQAAIAMAYEYVPDAIILDIELPELNGFEVCSRVKQNEKTSHIPVIMLTARGERPIRLEGLSAGAINFIPKDTFSNAVLIETLRQLKILQ